MITIAVTALGIAIATQTAPPTPTATSDAEPTEEPTAATTLNLERGHQLLEMHEYEEAQAELELALKAGPYTLPQVIRLYRDLGIVHAYAGDETAARWAFTRLLAVEPGHVLRYTLSPKATFVFEQVRREMRTRRGLEVTLQVDPVVPFDQPVTLQLERTADPLELLERLEVRHRVRGDERYTSIDVTPPPVGQPKTIELPAVTEDQAAPDDDGTLGAIVEVTVAGYDAAGWEIYSNPTPTRPLQVPVGFDAPGPWYTQWWIWGLIGGGAAAVVTGATVAVVMWPLPPVAPASYEVQ